MKLEQMKEKMSSGAAKGTFIETAAFAGSALNVSVLGAILMSQGTWRWLPV
jgi:hypothetical protein